MVNEDCKICGDVRSDNICKDCQIQLGDDKFAMKCLNCGSYGFLKRNKENFDRVKVFLGEEGMRDIDNYWVVIIPIKYCPACMEDYKDESKDSRS